MMRFWVIGCFYSALFVFGLISQGAFAGADLQFDTYKTTATIPRARQEFPVPKDPDQVFYIQRSLNSNTVVYAAQFDRNGVLKTAHSIRPYWRRFDTDARIKPLKWVENAFAYGVESKRDPTTNHHNVTFKALSQISAQLRQSGPNQAALWTRLEGRDLRLEYAFLDLDETGLVPKVARLRLYGTDPDSGLVYTYVFSVSGGEFQ